MSDGAFSALVGALCTAGLLADVFRMLPLLSTCVAPACHIPLAEYRSQRRRQRHVADVTDDETRVQR